MRYRRGADNLAADYLSRSATNFDRKVNDETENLERHVYTMDIPAIGNTDVVNEIGCQGAENDFIVQLESTSFSKMLADAQRLDPVTTGAISQIMEDGYITHGQ